MNKQLESIDKVHDQFNQALQKADQFLNILSDIVKICETHPRDSQPVTELKFKVMDKINSGLK